MRDALLPKRVRMGGVAFPERLPTELAEVLRSVGVDSSGGEVPFLRRWRLEDCALVGERNDVLEVHVVSEQGGDLLLKLRVDAVPDAYYKPAPGEEPDTTDFTPLAVNLGTLVKETVETKPVAMSTELDLRP